MIKSKALEINLADYHVDVDVDSRYAVLQEVMSKYYGRTEGLNNFLTELSHPYKNWQFIVKEARGYALDYFHLIKTHPKGDAAAGIFVDIFFDAMESTSDPDVRIDSVDNLLLFLQTIIKDSGTGTENFRRLLDRTFDRIRICDDEYFSLFVRSFYQLKKLAGFFVNGASGVAGDYRAINLLLEKYYKQTYDYWQGVEDPQKWFEDEAEDIGDKIKLNDIFQTISHARIGEWRQALEAVLHNGPVDSEETLKQLVHLPGYNQVVEAYRKIPQQLLSAGAPKGQGNRWKLIFIFHIMNISGLSIIHEETLKEINNTLTKLIGEEKSVTIQKMLQKTFSILKACARLFPDTALNCVLNTGKAVYKTDDSELINFFIDSLIDLGFQTPMIGGVGNDWQIKVNSAHMLNIRVWLELIELNPKRSIRLLSALIIHLSLYGVFIKDTDLFPRDITKLLNSRIEPAYNLVKQLSRLFPVYFNDIGAEGELREISTQIDEICHRKDVLIHFLRKQSHVESSNRIIGFMEALLSFWETKEKRKLEPFVPPNLFQQVMEQGPYIDGVHRIMRRLKTKGISLPDDLITNDIETINRLIAGVRKVSPEDKERVGLAASLYKLLNQKYNLNFIDMDHYLYRLKSEAFPDLERLKEALAESEIKKKLFKLIDYLSRLKELILSSKVYESREDIYKKRHFTIDIPSMYGSYHEIKFDALGLTFRIEALVNTLFEELIEDIDLTLITKATFFQLYDRLRLFEKALKVDGISTMEIERQLEFVAHSLEVRGFTFTQYLDIFKGFARAVKNIINDYFNNIHELNLNRILIHTPFDWLLKRYLPQEEAVDQEKLIYRVSEIFFRERISMSLGLQQLDIFLTRILNTLYSQSNLLPKDKLHQLLLYDHHNAMTSIDQAEKRVSRIIHLGNKGQNMVKLKSFGMPVPPGFIITTEVFRCRKIISGYPPAEQNFKEQVARHISELERITGKLFGDPKNPLLFSVRSGSSISQPGMMDTFLNVGINERITESIASRTGNVWFAWDNYRRFLQCYGMSYDLERDDFDAVISGFKQKLGIPFKRWFSGEQMKDLALSYKRLIQDAGIRIIQAPFDQLLFIIRKVFDSWQSSKAKAYRKIMGISDDWGTAATIQAMVYGNISDQSGTGVVFTHNPRWSEESLSLWGDFTLENQGEDVVSGLVQTMPISIIQQEKEKRETDLTLETHFPEIYTTLNEWANYLIYQKGWSPQEMEFTFEGPSKKDLYLLQSRDMTIRERKQAITFDPDGIKKQVYLGHGIGVSGGALSGRMVFTLEEIDNWRSKEPDTSLILVRGDTVPDDIREIYASDGLLTARGGLTSHAAVVAHRLDKTCVVGCGNLICDEKEKKCRFNQVVLNSGEFISINGQEGSVYQGFIKVKED